MIMDNIPRYPLSIQPKEYSNFTPISEVEDQAKPRRARIFDNYTTLGAILDHHEATIHKRWLKKTREQRRKVLLCAWSAVVRVDGGRETLSSSHRPDFAALSQQDFRRGDGDSAYRDAYLMPYLNQEDLLWPRRLLLLLHSRARYPPAAFVTVDVDAMRPGLGSNHLTPSVLKSHAMIFIGRDFPKYPADSYGEIVHRSKYPEAEKWRVQRQVPQTAEGCCGLLALEAQDRLMIFLVACVKEILHDFSQQELIDGATQVLFDEGVRAKGTILTVENMQEKPSWVDSGAEAPYKPPMQLDFASLETLFLARRDSIADHIWALRDDPGYFVDRLTTKKEHMSSELNDFQGRKDPWSTPAFGDKLFQMIVISEIRDSYRRYECWSDLHAQAARLRSLQESIPMPSPGEELPEPFIPAILRLGLGLQAAVNSPISAMNAFFHASPPMRRFFMRVPDTSSIDGYCSVLKPDAKFDKPVFRLWFLLCSLWGHGAPLTLVGLVEVVDELQRLIDTEQSVKDAISDLIGGMITELAILCEGCRQLQYFQPWIETLHREAPKHEGSMKEEFVKYPDFLMRLRGKLVPNTARLTKFCVPLDKRFVYPIEKRRTSENVKLLCKAEANLDLFWSKVDEAVGLKVLEGRFLYDLLTAPRSKERTKPWTEPTKSASHLADSNFAADRKEQLQPAAQLHFDLHYRTEHTLKDAVWPPAPKLEKTKTRGPARTPSEAAQISDNSCETPPEESLSTLTVDFRALKTFRTLFYTPSATGMPGELAWTDFKHALAAVGFSARKLYGSVWQLTPAPAATGTSMRSIHFHEPHPSGKLAFRVARRYGRRLHRAYGWDIGTFNLAGFNNKVSG